MEITLNNLDEIVHYKQSSYHAICFLKLISTRKVPLMPNEISILKKKSKDYYKDELLKHEVYQFIQRNYDVTVISKNVFQRLATIYNGDFKNMVRGIPKEELLELWQLKITLLNKIYQTNKNKGNEMNTDFRILYDLSVLVNKYDEYIALKRKQKLSEQNDLEINTQLSNNTNLTVLNCNNDNLPNETNYEQLLEELF